MGLIDVNTFSRGVLSPGVCQISQSVKVAETICPLAAFICRTDETCFNISLGQLHRVSAPPFFLSDNTIIRCRSISNAKDVVLVAFGAACQPMMDLLQARCEDSLVLENSILLMQFLSQLHKT
jgi:hypothetical protein